MHQHNKTKIVEKATTMNELNYINSLVFVIDIINVYDKVYAMVCKQKK